MVFHHALWISCELNRVCPQRLMARVLGWIGISAQLSWNRGWGEGACFFIYLKHFTSRGQYSSRLMPLLYVHRSRLRLKQTLVNLALASYAGHGTPKLFKTVATGFKGKYFKKCP
jgi:hypothetical protein